MRLSDLKTEAVVASGGEGGEQSPSPSRDEQPLTHPTGVAEAVTPNGTEIYYQSGPKRLYRVNGVEVPSASTVLQVLEKGGLSWWGMKVGVQGVLDLISGLPEERAWHIESGKLVESNPGGGRVLDAELLVDELKAAKLTVNHVKDKAADRGTNVHSALELYAETGVFPDPSLYPENEAGYVMGLVRFLKDAQPEIEMSEVMVASPTLGYAGRFDAVARLKGGKAVVKCYPKKADVVDVVDPSWRLLLDLKTSKDVYESYHLQVAGYEGALEECGYEPVDKTAVVRVTKDGKYELVFGRATPEDFAAVLDVYHILRRIKGKS